MSDPAAPDGISRSSMFKGAMIGLVAVILAFVLGFLPMWLKAGRSEKEGDAARAELRVSQLQSTLASAAIDARRGEYERARQAASEFFSRVSEETDRGAESAFTAAQRGALAPLFSQRDQIITLLARSDPASADRLSDLHVAFRKAAGR